MHVKRVILCALLAGVVLASPTSASADWLLTPYLGANFGASADYGDLDDFDDEFERRLNVGASIGWMGNGIVGFEADFGWSPNFFENTIGTGNFDFGDNNVVTVMANVLVGAPVGGQTGPGIRPYASGGLGLIRSRVSGGDFFDALSTNDLGFNVGGGLHGFFTDNLGVRGDIRLFRAFEDNERDSGLDLKNLEFWRATVGLTIRFGN